MSKLDGSKASMPKDDISIEAYQEIRKSLPGYFENFSHEFLTQMIFDFDRGYPPHTGAWLTDDARKEYDASPRQFLISLLKKERDGANRCLKALGAENPLTEKEWGEVMWAISVAEGAVWNVPDQKDYNPDNPVRPIKREHPLEAVRRIMLKLDAYLESQGVKAL